MRILPSLRARLFLVGIAVLAPMAVYFVINAGYERQDAIDRARLEATSFAGLTLETHARIVEDAEVLLDLMTRRRDLPQLPRTACNAMMADIIAGRGQYANLMLVDRAGKVTCSALALTKPINLADRPWFVRAIATGEFALGEYQIDRVSGKASLNMAMPIAAPDGTITALAVVAIDLEWLGNTLTSTDLPDGSAITFIDQGGTVLARQPDPRSWVGREIGDTPLFAEISRSDHGVGFEAPGLDGDVRLYHAFQLGSQSGFVYAVIGIPLQPMIQASHRQLLANLAILASLSVLVAAFAVWVGEVSIARPIRALAEMSRKIGAGDLAVRSALRSGASEIRMLSENLDQMAAAIDRYQSALRDSEQRFRHLVEATAAIPYTRDVMAGRNTYVGPQLAALLGDPTAAWIDDLSFLAWVDPEDRDRVRDDLRRHGRRVADGQSEHQSEYRLVAKDGRRLWVRDLIRFGAMSDGQVIGSGVIIDVSQSKAQGEQLFQLQKLEAVGQLASGVAHDFNNLLAVIESSLFSLRRTVADDPIASRRLTLGVDAARRGAELTQHLLSFSRRQALQPRVVEINDLVRDFTELLSRSLGEMIKIDLHLADDLPPGLIDPAQLEAALLNLALNARDSMPAGGTVTIRTGHRPMDNRLGSDAQPTPQGYVAISVADTGCGMSPETAARACEPFFTTKEVGKGTGLGLSMVYGFVQQSNGQLTIDSRIGDGTTVTLLLPVDDEDTDVPAAAAKEESLLREATTGRPA